MKPLLLFLAMGKGGRGSLPLLFALGSSQNGAQGASRLPSPVLPGKSRGNALVTERGPISWGARAPAALVEEAEEIADRHGLDPGWLLSSWRNESGWNPAAHNSIGGGLFGLLWNYLPKGMTPAQWLALSAPEQARYYEQLYGSALDSLHSIDDTRLLGWGRRDLFGKPDSTVAWRRGDPAYAANASLDAGKKGYLTKGDLVAHGRALFQEGLQ